MAVKRIVANIAAETLEGAKTFYADILGLRMVMDQGWIMTFAAETSTSPRAPRTILKTVPETAPSPSPTAAGSSSTRPADSASTPAAVIGSRRRRGQGA